LRVVPAEIPGVLLVEPDVHRDDRGYFLETFHADKYRAAGIAGPFVQDNHSRSVVDTVRGLHMQIDPAQAKLIRVVEGEIFDVAVDLRRGSPTFGRWVGHTLSAGNFRQCYIPHGFAHAFCVRSAFALVEYKCSAFYNPAGEIGVAWNDPAIGIRWPIERPLLSPRDERNPRLAEVMAVLPDYRA